MNDDDKLPRTRAEAKEKGLKRYFTGTPCRNGHVAERYSSSGRCIECVSECNRKIYEKDPAKKIKSAQKWYAENKGDKLKYDLERYHSNPKVKVQQLEWKRANSDKMSAYRQKWISDNPGKHKESQRLWALNNPETVQANVRARRARKRNAEGRHSTSDVDAILERQKFKCAECGIDISDRKSRQVDHMMPLKLGGSNWPSNLQLLCIKCNKVKGAKHPIDFAAKRGRLV